jgi:hypothetical protein
MDYVWEKAASGDLDTCCDIMGRIYGENPQHWPFGLDRSMMSPGGLYIVKDAHSSQPAGFVGWQEFREGPIKVGYYSIGILPEFRQRGLAKSAVRQLIAEKSAGVDEVRAMIHASNRPSIGLAESLDIPIEKVALARAIGRGLAHPVTHGLGTAGMMDVLMNTKGEPLNDMDTWRDYGEGLSESSALRPANFLLNTLLGAGASSLLRGKGAPIPAGATGPDIAAITGANQKAQAARLGGAAAAAGGVVTKDLAMMGLGEGPKWLNSEVTKNRAVVGALAALLAGGAGYAGYKAFGPKKEEDRGRIRVTLPTRGPDDQETQVEMPFNADHVGISNALQGQLARDIRRRLHQESKSRTRTRGGKHVDETTGTLRPNRKEWDSESSPTLSLN